MGDIHLKLYIFWISGSEGNVVLKKKLMDGWIDDRQRSITICHLEPKTHVSSKVGRIFTIESPFVETK